MDSPCVYLNLLLIFNETEYSLCNPFSPVVSKVSINRGNSSLLKVNLFAT